MGVPATEDVAEALRNATVTCNDQVLRQLLVHASAALQRESERATAAEARATAAETALQHERHRSDGVLREIKDELRSVHSYARRTHTTLTSAVTKSGQLYNALASSHNKSIVNPRGRRLQPGIALLDTSNCPTQRRIYGDAWPRMVKMIEGQRGKHIHTTINTLTEEGAVLLREYEYYPNGITHRDNLKGSLDGWLESKNAQAAAGFIWIATFGFDPDHLDLETFVTFFDEIVTLSMQVPVEYDGDEYTIEAPPRLRNV